MLRLLLNAHRNIGVPKELAYFERCARFTDLEQWQSSTISIETYREFVRGFLQKKKVALEGLDLKKLEEEIVTSCFPHLERPFKRVMDAWAKKEGKQVWGEKTPKNLFYVDIIQAMFPESRFIYVIRDPRAVVYSMNRFARFQDDSVLNAFNWQQAATRGYQLLMNHVPEERRYILRYEDLVAEVETVTKELCSFIGESFEKDMLNFYLQSNTNIHPNSRDLGGTNTLTKPVTSASVDKWRQGLSSKEIADVEAICSKQMHHFGYKLTGNTSSTISGVKRSLKLAYCQWQQHRNKQARAYQIAFKPLDKTRLRLKMLVNREGEA